MSYYSASLLSATIKEYSLPLGLVPEADILERAEAEVAAAKAAILRADLGPGGSSLV